MASIQKVGKGLKGPKQEFKFELWTQGRTKKEGGKDGEVAKGGIG
jgi:hypothetical protein